MHGPKFENCEYTGNNGVRFFQIRTYVLNEAYSLISRVINALVRHACHAQFHRFSTCENVRIYSQHVRIMLTLTHSRMHTYTHMYAHTHARYCPHMQRNHILCIHTCISIHSAMRAIRGLCTYRTPVPLIYGCNG